MKTTIIYCLVLVFILTIVCCRATSLKGLVYRQEGNENIGKLYDDKYTRIVKKPSYEPLPVDFLSEITNNDFASSWGISFYTYDDSQPPKRTRINIGFYTYEGYVAGSGYRTDHSQSYDYYFPTNEQFLEIVAYIGRNTLAI